MSRLQFGDSWQPSLCRCVLSLPWRRRGWPRLSTARRRGGREIRSASSLPRRLRAFPRRASSGQHEPVSVSTAKPELTSTTGGTTAAPGSCVLQGGSPQKVQIPTVDLKLCSNFDISHSSHDALSDREDILSTRPDD